MIHFRNETKTALKVEENKLNCNKNNNINCLIPEMILEDPFWEDRSTCIQFEIFVPSPFVQKPQGGQHQ